MCWEVKCPSILTSKSKDIFIDFKMIFDNGMGYFLVIGNIRLGNDVLLEVLHGYMAKLGECFVFLCRS